MHLTEHRRRADQRAGLERMELDQLVKRQFLLFALQIHDLTADHAVASGTVGKIRHRHCGGFSPRRDVGRRRLKGTRQERIARQKRRTLAKHLVIGGLPATQIVVIHARKIVVNE